MNALEKVCNEISIVKRAEVAGQIMKMFKAITPQFYKSQTDTELRDELISIELCLGRIDQSVLSRMCELAVLNYSKLRSKNEKAFFDINYLLSFYKQAFNKVNCDDVYVSKNAECLGSTYDWENEIVTETYKEPDGREIVVREIQEHIGKTKPERIDERCYSSKHFEWIVTDLSDLGLVL